LKQFQVLVRNGVALAQGLFVVELVPVFDVFRLLVSLRLDGCSFSVGVSRQRGGEMSTV
jgi:hypothetical protein